MGQISHARTSVHTDGPALPRRHVLAAALGVGLVAPTGWLPEARAAGTAAPAGPDLLPAGCPADWVTTLFDVTWAEAPSPTNAARMYAYCAIAMYEAVAPHTSGLRSLSGQLHGLGAMPRRPAGRVDTPCALSAAVAGVAHHLYAAPASQQAVSDELDRQLAGRRAVGVPEGVVRTSVDHGRRVAAALRPWIDGDGHAGLAGRGYTPPAGPALWRPTPPNFGTAIEPYWSEVRPMVLRGPAEVVPAPPLPFSTEEGSPFWEQAEATWRTGRELTDEQRRIAMFWRDNPVTSALPSGHWMRVVMQVTQQRGMSLSAAVEAYVRTAVALHDAFLNCWTWKYRVNLLRPVSYVHEYMQAGVPEADKWRTFVNTPQFPEYTSGHSVASRAASTVLTDLLGVVPFTDHHPAAPGGGDTRSFVSFHQAADEAAVSRLYGGIHFPMGIDNGLAQGDTLGALVIARLHTRR
jgi:hypothetical protein